MKKNLIAIAATGVLLAVTAQAQTSSSDTSSGTAGENNGNRTLPPGLQQQNPLPPGLRNRDQLPPGLAGRTNNAVSQPGSGTLGSTTNAAFGGHQIGSATNSQGGTAGSQYGAVSNRFGSGLTPTSTRTNSTDTIYRGSQSSVRTGSAAPDHATSQTDQQLLTTIRQTVSTEISSLAVGSSAYTATGNALPVTFNVRGGVVELAGTVPTQQEKQRIETIVQRVPGVTRVENQLQIATENLGTTASTTSSSRDSFSSTNSLMPTSTRTNSSNRNYSSTNRFSGSDTNLSATGRTNSPTGSLPSGLEKRESLPPGLEKRDQLPPGLQRGGTNQ